MQKIVRSYQHPRNYVSEINELLGYGWEIVNRKFVPESNRIATYIEYILEYKGREKWKEK